MWEDKSSTCHYYPRLKLFWDNQKLCLSGFRFAIPINPLFLSHFSRKNIDAIPLFDAIVREIVFGLIMSIYSPQQLKAFPQRNNQIKSQISITEATTNFP